MDTMHAMSDVLGWIAANKEALGVIGAAVTAVCGGAWSVYKSRKESKRASSPVGGPQPIADSTVAEARGMHSAAADPNLIVLDCRVINFELDDDLVVREVLRGEKQAAIVLLRNDPMKGRRVGEMVNTRALLTLFPDGGTPVHIASAQWLDSSLNCVDFAPGDMHKLVIAVGVPLIENLAALDDGREINGSDAVRPVELPVGMKRADVRVKLVGGFNSEFVEEFRFELSTDPLTLRQVV